MKMRYKVFEKNDCSALTTFQQDKLQLSCHLTHWSNCLKNDQKVQFFVLKNSKFFCQLFLTAAAVTIDFTVTLEFKTALTSVS